MYKLTVDRGYTIMDGKKQERGKKQEKKIRPKDAASDNSSSAQKTPHRGFTPDGNIYMVWREDYKAPKAPENKNSAHNEIRGNKPEDQDIGSHVQKRKTGKRLFVKTGVENDTKTQDVPPAGYERHKDIQYRSLQEDETAKNERKHSRTHRQAAGRLSRSGSEHNHHARKANIAPPTEEKSLSTVENVPTEMPVKSIFTIGMGRRPLQKILQKLVDAGVQVVIDLRSEEAMAVPGFTKARDLAILLKEAAGIEFRRDEVLLPRRDILEHFRRDNNWTRFSATFQEHLVHFHPEKVLSREMFSRHAVALLGEQPVAERSVRIVVANYLTMCWNIQNIINL